MVHEGIEMIESLTISLGNTLNLVLLLDGIAAGRYRVQHQQSFFKHVT